MKPSTLNPYLLRCLAAGIVALPLMAAAAVVQHPAEIHLSADLDGDGRQDIVIIDRASGALRMAYQTLPGVLQWAQPRASGISEISGAATGKWFTTAHDSIAVASTSANRIHFLDASVPGGVPGIEALFAAGIGPDQLASPDVGGPGNTVHADLWLSSTENGAPSPVRLAVSRHNGSDFTTLQNTGASRRPVEVVTVPLKDGGTEFVAYVSRSLGTDDLFTVLSYASGQAELVMAMGLPEGSSWTSGKLSGPALHHVLSWVPGETKFLAHSVSESLPDVFSLQPETLHELGFAFGRIHIVKTGAVSRIVVVALDGLDAAVFEFDGAGNPQLLQTLTPEEGESITGLMPLSGGGFQLLLGAVGSGKTTTAVAHFDNGGLFEPASPVALPALRPAAMRANVFAFAADPFLNPAAALLSRYNIPEWTSGADLQGDQLAVDAETFGGAASGLGTKQTIALGTVPAGTAFALTSQVNEAVSVHSFDSVIGTVGARAEISPLPGIKTQAVEVTFAASPANALVYYRLGNGPWVQWDSASPSILIADTDVRFYAVDPITLAPSSITVAQYRFEQLAHELDSDNDGVPDFVEMEYGLHPLRGVDSDGDGFSDLNEILVGTLPDDAASKPLNTQRLEENLAFRMRVAPRPVDGTTGLRTSALVGSRMELYGIDGASLGGSEAAFLATPGVAGPGHAVDNVVADRRLGIVVMMTEPVFGLVTVDADKDRGRELAGLFLIPEAELPAVNYVPGGGSSAVEAAAWIAAALEARNSAVRPLVVGNWNEIDTLAGLLLEKKLESIFMSRSLPALDIGKLTLFGGRTGDAGRRAPTAVELDDLRLQLSPNQPGYDVRALFESIAISTNSAASMAQARAIATAIYRLSSLAANEAALGTYLPPFDVLRSFARGAALPEPYASGIAFTPAEVAAAQTAMAGMLDSLAARPVETLSLVVNEETFTGGCAGLTLLGTDQQVYLFAAAGRPYGGTDGFDLLPGTRLLVTGYTDIISGACFGQGMEVIDVMVISFPPADSVDADGNLLLDEWEWAFLLGSGNPFDDDDNDGFSNLQEMLDGTDPLDPNSLPLELVDLAPPAIEVLIDEDQNLLLWWSYPLPYANSIEWLVEISADMIEWQPVAVDVVEVEPGVFAAVIANPLDLFFRVRLLISD